MKKLLGLVAAAAAGVAAGVLMAPKSGRETREDLKRKATDAKEYASDKKTRVQAAVKDGYESVRSTASTVKDEASGLADHAKSSAKNLSDDAKERRARVAPKAERTLGDLRSDAESLKK